MAGAELSAGGRRLQQWGYYYSYNTNANRWLYWTIPLIAIGVGGLVFALVFYWIRRRRRFQNPQPTQQQGPTYGAPYGAAYGTPVTGYPQDQQYSQYNNYSSQPSYPPQQPYQAYPQQQQPGASSWSQPQPGGKAGSVEMGSPLHNQQQPYSGYPRGA